MGELKHLFVEPRAGDKDQFEKSMKKFYKAVQDSTKHEGNLFTRHPGALFLAVCRGKVSEGLDFADENARAVVLAKSRTFLCFLTYLSLDRSRYPFRQYVCDILIPALLMSESYSVIGATFKSSSSGIIIISTQHRGACRRVRNGSFVVYRCATI